MFRKRTSLLALVLSIFTYGADKVTAQISEQAPIEISQTGWVVSADSFQNNGGNAIGSAFDDNLQTFWHTEWDPTLAQLPHTVNIDMQNQYVVNGFSYTPRQDGVPNGRIGTHEIYTSVDGNTYTLVASGTWANDATVKNTAFTPIIGRYVRLIARTEAQNQGFQWSSAAEIKVLTNPHATLLRNNWAVSADSSETSIQSYVPQYAIDGAATTWWHTPFLNSQPGFPHWFQIDQGSAISVGGLSYLPRIAASGANGRIGQYTVEYSTNGGTWTPVASGTWADTQYIKYAEWTPVTARYWRLVSNSEAGNRGPWSSAAEINLLDGANSLANFVVDADSEEINADHNAAYNALDGDPSTIWHSQYYPNALPFPHYFTVDMGVAMPATALQYLPRQDGGSNGNIGAHVIDVSTDGNTWTTVASGAFADNPDVKVVEFQEIICRFVRLTATSEAGNRGTWSSAAEITVSYDPTYIAPAPNAVGQWGMTVNFPLVPVAVGLVATTGQVIAWSSWDAEGWTFGGDGGQTLTALYDPPSGTVSKAMIVSTKHDMFCPGISMDFSGRIIVTGGDSAPLTSIYDPNGNDWITAANMNIGRGYQSSATLSNGQIFTIGGSWNGGEGGKNGESYDPFGNVWTSRPNSIVSLMLTNDAQGVYRADNHAWLFAWKQDVVFQAGPSSAMNWYATGGTGGYLAAGNRGDSGDAMCGNAVMYDAVGGNILTFGGSPDYQANLAVANTYLITINNVGPVQTTKLAAMAYPRIFANGVALPNGQVFVAGGQTYGFPFIDDSSIMYPELWDPNSKKWTIMAPYAIPRNYHSVGLLMPDATVLVGGGGLCDGCQENHYDAQVWKPPYLFTSSGALAARPVIASTSSGQVGVGGSFTITMSSTTTITSVALMRMGTSTHTVNTDQRRVAITPTSLGGNRYSIAVPNDPGILIPGYWMVFALAGNVPSISKTIQVTL